VSAAHIMWTWEPCTFFSYPAELTWEEYGKILQVDANENGEMQPENHQYVLKVTVVNGYSKT
jgi:hypothetical protein